MTARDIQRRIMSAFYREVFTLHNYTPKNWFECDIFQVTKAGYMVEFEIKMTVQDFKADAKKAKEQVTYKNDPNGVMKWLWAKGQTKHEQLAARAENGPSRFYFVVPVPALPLTPDDVPEWAGLIHMDTTTAKSWRQIRPEIAKPAPTLHRAKVEAKILAHAESVCYYRMHNLLIKS